MWFDICFVIQGCFFPLKYEYFCWSLCVCKLTKLSKWWITNFVFVCFDPINIYISFGQLNSISLGGGWFLLPSQICIKFPSFFRASFFVGTKTVFLLREPAKKSYFLNGITSFCDFPYLVYFLPLVSKACLVSTHRHNKSGRNLAKSTQGRILGLLGVGTEDVRGGLRRSLWYEIWQ